MIGYSIGIDGGGSRSRAILVDDQTKLIAQSEGRGLNPLTVGWDQFSLNVSELVQPLLEKKPADIPIQICAGLAGVGSDEVRRKTEADIHSVTGASQVFVISDALAALWGAFQGGPGLLLIAGTGSICLGMNEQGKIERTGGFGRLLGDEGGGYWIAIEAIKAGLLNVDGRGGSRRLLKLACVEFGLQEIREIIPLINSGGLSPGRIAAFAEKVLPMQKEDKIARWILSAAADYLAELVIYTASKLRLINPKLVLWGGLWNSPGEELTYYFLPAMKRRHEMIIQCDPEEPPEWGAIRYLLSSGY